MADPKVVKIATVDVKAIGNSMYVRIPVDVQTGIKTRFPKVKIENCEGTWKREVNSGVLSIEIEPKQPQVSAPPQDGEAGVE